MGRKSRRRSGGSKLPTASFFCFALVYSRCSAKRVSAKTSFWVFGRDSHNAIKENSMAKRQAKPGKKSGGKSSGKSKGKGGSKGSGSGGSG
jgi:hypothetical protein